MLCEAPAGLAAAAAQIMAIYDWFLYSHETKCDTFRGTKKHQRRAVESLPHNQFPGHTNWVHITIELYSSISFMYTQVMAIVLITNTVLYDLR
jgi:hypothetical protein